MDRPKSWAAVAGLVLLVGLGGAWLYAWATLTDRVSAFVTDVETIGYGRGGQLPDEASVRAQVAEAATAHELDVSDVTVSLGEHGGVGAVGQYFQDKLAAGPANAPTLRGRVLRVEVGAHVHADRWLWSVDEQVHATAELRARVELLPPPRSEPPPPANDAVRGL